MREDEDARPFSIDGVGVHVTTWSRGDRMQYGAAFSGDVWRHAYVRNLYRSPQEAVAVLLWMHFNRGEREGDLPWDDFDRHYKYLAYCLGCQHTKSMKLCHDCYDQSPVGRRRARAL